jgi:hypothetical protein
VVTQLCETVAGQLVDERHRGLFRCGPDLGRTGVSDRHGRLGGFASGASTADGHGGAISAHELVAKLCVGAVAVRRRAGPFARTQERLAVGLSGEGHRGELGARVGAVAERLVL